MQSGESLPPPPSPPPSSHNSASSPLSSRSSSSHVLTSPPSSRHPSLLSSSSSSARRAHSPTLEVYTWGRGEDGQLGGGDTSDQASPMLVDSLRRPPGLTQPNRDVEGKRGGRDEEGGGGDGFGGSGEQSGSSSASAHSASSSSASSSNPPSPFPHISVSSVQCGSGHTVVLSRDGEVYSWGRGDDGRLGHGDNAWKYVPRLVVPLVNLSNGHPVTKIACGSYHTACVTADGKMWTWGGAMYGKLGNGSETGVAIPTVVKALEGVVIVDIALGSRHTAAIAQGGVLYTWGDRDNGVLGHGDAQTDGGAGHQYAPRRVEALAGLEVVAIAACGFHNAAIVREGRLFTWGEGKFGRLGHGNEKNSPLPKAVEALEGARCKAVSCGGFHSAAITEDGNLYTWGGGEHGQLGLGQGEKINKSLPTVVETPANVTWTSVSLGWSHTVALSAAGKVYTFGNGDHGKLGHGSTSKVSVPKLVESLAHLKVVKIASYNEHSAVLAESQPSPYHPNSSSWTSGGGATPVSMDFVAQLKGLLSTGEFSDVTFVVEGREIPAHKALLSARSDHFRAMFASGMKESVDREVHIPDTRHSVFSTLLEFLYSDSMVNLDPEHCVEVWILADLYGLARLKELCSLVVRGGLSETNAALLLQRADDLSCQELKDVCLDFVVSNFDTVSKTEGIKSLSHSLLLEVLQKRP